MFDSSAVFPTDSVIHGQSACQVVKDSQGFGGAAQWDDNDWGTGEAHFSSQAFTGKGSDLIQSLHLTAYVI